MPVNLLNEGDLNKYLTKMIYADGEVPHWVSDKSSESQANLQSPDWVKEHRDEVVKAILLQYFKKRIRMYFHSDSNASFLKPVSTKKPGLPEWCYYADYGSVFRFDGTKVPRYLQDEIAEIRDYLYAMADKYVVDTAGLAKKTEKVSKIRLDYLKSSNEYASFDMVLAAAKLWHEKLAVKGKRTRKDEEFYKKSLEGTEFIMELPNNTFAYRLLTPKALDFESDNMGHCVGRGYYDEDVKNGITEIYSIRDERGEPHITFEIRKNNKHDEPGYIEQCKGKENKRPVDKYVPAIIELIHKYKWNTNDCRDLNGIFLSINNEIYAIKDLIDGKIKLPNVIDNSIDLSGIDLKKLPDFSNCVVNGNFNCSNNQLTSLEGAPQKVVGYFDCSGNQLTSLKGAPYEVGGLFNCSGNQLTSLEGAPKEVGGLFNCSGNQLTSLDGRPKASKYVFDNNPLQRCGNERE